MTDRLIGRYRLDALLGSGGFATVHRAHDEQLDAPVAVKILGHNHAVNPDVRSRFVAEGQTLRRLNSPHIVKAFDLAEAEDGRPFLVLEICENGTLRQRVTDARAQGWQPTTSDIVTVAVALAAAIGELHRGQIVHRDLSPANILIGQRTRPQDVTSPPASLLGASERLVITDLGFCKDLNASSGISATGGTDGFQAPEQQQLGSRVDIRTDLWASSAILAWLITGTTFTNQASANSALKAAGISPVLATAISHGLAEQPDDRPDTSEQWVGDIIQATPDVAVSPDAVAMARPGSRPLLSTRAALILLAVLAIGSFLVSRGGNDDSLAMDQQGDRGTPLTQLDDTQLDDLEVEEPEEAREPNDTLAEFEAAQMSDPGALWPVAPEMGPIQSHEWSFHLTSEEGWEYDIDVGVDATFYFGKDISTSAPGNALLTSAVAGTTSWEAVGTIADRDAPVLTPELLGHFDAEFTAVGAIFGSPCNSTLGKISRTGLEGAACDLWGPLERSDEDERRRLTFYESQPEPDVDRFLDATSDLTPDFYILEIGGAGICRMILHTDGTIVELPWSASGELDCIVS